MARISSTRARPVSGRFNKNNDPSSANIGVYTFDKDNKPVFDHTQSGDVPTD